ncbi:MAG: hypothetical protein V4574_14385 [Pseudomonadota bacterium]
MRYLGALALLIAATPGASAPPRLPASPRITEIAPVALGFGVNKVPGFLPGGGAATIVRAWRGNGNAHGYSAWMVLTGPSEGNAVGLAPFADGEELPVETIRDNPFDGERTIGAVRFARALVDGTPASIAIKADLDGTDGRPFADHERATIKVYRLVVNDEGLGPPLEFVRIAALHTDKRYCNAELALRDTLGIPLPAGHAGPNRDDGCF